ncbi:alpha/beta fold hydrolase [Citrobacter sp. RHB20-C16]|uniref:alpha/beta hydrolase n=1 Tax=Citrobacter TaxID=544 RepID=UPI0005C70F3B|nr:MULTISPECIES: alpha/beta fold hydrolase [Citrobacter]MBJ8736993.1 alpha/beta fold hydrolase [Citrobacter amalonaticus]MBJ9075672.1 alpha/beta fold hydrolase [Citrobacter amalonaticus]QMK79522.1 alpha/beta fold hydrolase [Citrobacter sp. RHB20-C16]QMK84137.1 alpha/beta fold hydrolase [Citrobacter sp. RHB20-C15]QPB31332.1 alpha/beta fold hydrolase [Citrobacter amalonaticus]
MLLKNLFRRVKWVSSGLLALIKHVVLTLLVVLIIFLGVRVYQTESGPDLHSWHTWHGNEMSAAALDNATFAQYQVREAALFADLQKQVGDTLSPDEQTPINRFWLGSRVAPGQFTPNWNRSFVLMPQGKPRGVAVMLHGLTDSPYSLKDIARIYQQQGFIAVVPRLPGHGTAPGALTAVDWEAWLAATRLAVREATRLAGNEVPLHLVGYSNGGALALKYTLDSLDDATLRRPRQVVLLSPMIGVTSFARFAGLAGLPALFPAFAKAAWLNVTPEFNPFKYNSFPVNAARQSYLLTKALQQQIVQDAQTMRLHDLPPVLTFQSVMDSTVSTQAVVESLYRYLGPNGSELVLFDINQAANLRPLLRTSSYTAAATLLPSVPRAYRTTVVTNATAETLAVVARDTLAGTRDVQVQPLQEAWPQEMYSLSHVAVPFPMTDSLYGLKPDVLNRYGLSIGTIALRGETSTLLVGLDTLMRVTSNPFFPYMKERIEAVIGRNVKN